MQPDLLPLLNNTTISLSHKNIDYLLLIKKQKNKQYCTMFLTDCDGTFWLQKIDVNFCQKLKQDMNVKTKLENFVKLLVQGIKNGGKIQSGGLVKEENQQREQEKDKEMRLKVQMKIGEGLVVNCTIELSICVDSEENPEQYKQLVKSFFKQLYEAKQYQIQQLKKQIQIMKQQPKVQEGKSADKGYVRNVLNLPSKKQALLGPAVPPKNRDLINPYKKKRKHQGLKLTGCD